MKPGTPRVGKGGCTWQLWILMDLILCPVLTVIVCAWQGSAHAISPENVPTTMAIANGYSILPLTERASNGALHLYIARQVHHEQSH